MVVLLLGLWLLFGCDNKKLGFFRSFEAEPNKSETHYKGDRLELVNMFLNDLHKLFGAQMSYFRGPG